MTGQQRDVFAPLAQRRHRNLNRVQTEEEILPEAARVDLRVEVGVCGGDDPDVGPPRAGTAHPLELAGLEHAQQLGLEVQRDVGDLIQEQRPAFGQFEAADAVALGVGEGAFDMAEELALEQPLRQAAGVHRHQGAPGAAGHGVQRLRDGALARAVLAGEQHVGVGRTHSRNQIEHRAHRDGLGDQRGAVGPLIAQDPVLCLEPLAAAQGAGQLDLCAHDREHALVVPGLLDEVPRAPAHGLDCQFHRAPGGHDDDRHRRVERLELREEREAFESRRRVPRVVEVDQRDVEVARVDGGQHAGGGGGGVDLAPLRLQQQAQRLKDVGLVVGQQDPRLVEDFTGHGCSRRGGVWSHQSFTSQPSFSRTTRVP